MKIVRATPSDAKNISELIHSLSHHFLATPTGPHADAFFDATSPDRMTHFITDSSRIYVVAYDNQDLAGFIALKNTTQISQFFVEPRWQGKGLGRKLWNEVRLISGANEDSEFTVDSSLGAVPIYERFGFATCGPITQQGGVVFTPMRRPIRPK